MVRAIMALVVGALFGAAAAAIALRAGVGRDEPAAEAGRPRLASSDGASSPTALDPSQLEAMIDQAAAEPDSYARAIELEQLLLELARLEPARAARIAASLGLNERLVARLYRSWAEADVEGALAALATTPSPAARRTAALALSAVLGYGAASLARIKQQLPPLEAVHFELDAIAALAESDLQAAIQAGLALDGFAKRREALTRIAAALARRDAQGALAGAAAIDDYALLTAYRASVLRTWAETDRERLFAYLGSADPSEIPGGADLLAAIAARGPERLLAAAGRFSPALRSAAETAVLEILAARDPLGAYARIDELGADANRESRLRRVARVHAEQDPAAALAFARSLQGDDRVAVLEGIADVDLVGPVELLLDDYSRIGGEDRTPLSAIGQLVITRLATPATRSASAQIGAVLDRLARVDDANVENVFGYLLGEWGTYQAEEALSWALAHPSLVPESAYASIARGLGDTNPELAIQASSRLPAPLRDAWIASAAVGMAQRDLRGALDWISRYRGHAFYEETVASIVRAATDVFRGAAAGLPRAAAEFLDGASASMRADLLPQVAAAWARQEPAAAGEWVMHLELDSGDEQRRTRAVRNIAAIWSRADAGAATRWALQLEQGATRDAALGTALSSLATTGRIDTRMLEAFSSDAARQEAVTAIAAGLAAAGSTDLARELIDTYVTDPEQRRQAEEAIERRSLGPGTVGPGGGIGILL